MHRQDRAHRQAGDEDHIAFLAQLGVRLFDGPVPILPSRLFDIFGGAAVARELRADDGMPRPGKALSNEAHLHGRAAKPMNQQEARAPARKAIPLIDCD